MSGGEGRAYQAVLPLAGEGANESTVADVKRATEAFYRELGLDYQEPRLEERNHEGS